MEITKAIYESSASGRCWAFTPYGDGWDNCPDLRKDAELAALIRQEQALGPLPRWVTDVVQKINYRPSAPTALFPCPI